MVCSYSFELSQKTVSSTFILNYNLICLLILKIFFLAFLHHNIFFFFFFFNLMHFFIKLYMVCSYSFELSPKTVRKPTRFILNYYFICPYLEAIEKVRFFFYLMHFSIKIYMEYIDTLSNCLRKQYLQHLFQIITSYVVLS